MVVGTVPVANIKISCQFGNGAFVAGVNADAILSPGMLPQGAQHSALTVICIAPASPSGTFDLRVNLSDGSQAGTTPFMFVAPVTIDGFLPHAGSADAHTIVTVTGSNFLNSEQLCCAFVSGSQALFTRPPRHRNEPI